MTRTPSRMAPKMVRILLHSNELTWLWDYPEGQENHLLGDGVHQLLSVCCHPLTRVARLLYSRDIAGCTQATYIVQLQREPEELTTALHVCIAWAAIVSTQAQTT